MRIDKIVFFLAFLVLIGGLIVKFTVNTQKTKSFIADQKLPTVSPQIYGSAVATPAAQLNLQGPFVCEFSTPQASMSGYIKNNKLFGQIKDQLQTKRALLNGDCVYIWDTASSEGKKICGVSQYLSILNFIPLSSLLGDSRLLSKLPIPSGDVQKFVNSCKKREIPDEKIFSIPVNVVFK